MAASICCYGVSNLATTWQPSTSPWRPHSGHPISNPDLTMVTPCRSHNQPMTHGVYPSRPHKQHPTRPMTTTLVGHINSTRPACLLFLPPNFRPHLLSTPLIRLEKPQRSNLYPLLSHETRTTPYMGTLISPFMVADQQPWRPCPAPSR